MSSLTDLSGAFSSGYGHMSTTIYCPEGIPVEQALFAILAAFGAAFGYLYRALTIVTGGRKKRGAAPVPWYEKAADFYWWGKRPSRCCFKELRKRFLSCSQRLFPWELRFVHTLLSFYYTPSRSV